MSISFRFIDTPSQLLVARYCDLILAQNVCVVPRISMYCDMIYCVKSRVAMVRVREFEDHDEEREYQVGKLGDPRYIDDVGIDGVT